MFTSNRGQVFLFSRRAEVQPGVRQSPRDFHSALLKKTTQKPGTPAGSRLNSRDKCRVQILKALGWRSTSRGVISPSWAEPRQSEGLEQAGWVQTARGGCAQRQNRVPQSSHNFLWLPLAPSPEQAPGMAQRGWRALRYVQHRRGDTSRAPCTWPG